MMMPAFAKVAPNVNTVASAIVVNVFFIFFLLNFFDFYSKPFASCPVYYKHCAKRAKEFIRITTLVLAIVTDSHSY